MPLPDKCFPPNDPAEPCDYYASAMAEIARIEVQNERLRTALAEIAAMRCEDLPLADGQPEDNLAAQHARLTLEQRARSCPNCGREAPPGSGDLCPYCDAPFSS